MQSKRASILETITSVVIGYLVSLVTNAIVLPMFGLYLNIWEYGIISLMFTGVSITRGYFVRRLFNHIGRKS